MFFQPLFGEWIVAVFKKQWKPDIMRAASGL
jgi:hypothetical protein